ncbi:glycosyltransferase family 9 protein [Hydrogenophaga pseudoflava]|uniref:glycosyltransferase family 9 protein n=1 Tax=Hydrogenophaga pseudoflava TaxID=47421 RepID=UPI0027E40136|nr:glycosyltransferase family 9 protein [Hydrogenophaga pseudoflava]MDQ7744401.1 glycosyltransferase family 9 protein [Hydrogenophaga pseudoflava]
MAGRAQALYPRRIGVFRALMLGDLVCATPALRALRQGWPAAHITLVGLPWAAAWAGRLPWVDDFVVFPGWPGLPEREPPPPPVQEAFIRGMRRRRLDLAIQLHGSGDVTHALVKRFGARHTAGFHLPGAEGPARPDETLVPWPAGGHEIERLLAVTDRLGLPRRGLQTDWPLRDEDRRRARALLPFEGRFAIVHVGSQWPSRRWPPERFAAVAERLACQGLAIVLTGVESERALTRAIAERIVSGPVVDLAGRTDLWTMGGLVAEAQLLVGNDTGPAHIAAALGTPSVAVACGSEVARWAPLDAARHRVLWSDHDCRPCSHRQCPTSHECAQAVAVEPVAQAALASVYKEPQHVFFPG